MREYKESNQSHIFKSMSDFAFYNAGYEECKPSHSYGPICRSYQLIHFVLQGKGELHINNHVYQVSAGETFIIPSNKVAYYEADAEEPWCYSWLGFLGINSLSYAYQIIDSTPTRYIIPSLDTQSYKEKIFHLLELKNRKNSHYFRSNSILLDIMASLYEDLGLNEMQHMQSSLANDVKFFLDINYPEKIKIEDVAHSFSVHPNYLSRKFREAYHISPKQYLMDLKLKRACKLLTTTDLPIAIISESLGFNDQFSFAKQFKNKHGISPSGYRKTEFTSNQNGYGES